MRALIASALLGFASTAANALPDVQTLARFDLGFARCEARFAHMKGHRDEAYLALWKIKPDAQQRAALDRQRQSAAYRKARGEAQKTQAPDSAQLEEKLRNQCAATWSEMQRNRPPGGTPPPTK
jgi:hypothetical protein